MLGPAIYLSEVIYILRSGITGKLIFTNSKHIYLVNFPYVFRKKSIYSLLVKEKHNLGTITDVDFSSDKRSIIFSKNKGIMEPHQLYLLNLDSKDVHQLTDGEKDCVSPSWSPDGIAIAFLASPGYKLHIFNTNNKQMKCISQIHCMRIKPSWSPDGQKIAFTAQRKKMLSDTAYTYYGEIYIIDIETGKEEKIITGSSPVWLPDGKRIICLYEDGFYSIDVVNGGAPKKIYSSYRLNWFVLSPDGKFILYHLHTPDLSFPSDGFHILSLENLKRKLNFGKFSGIVHSFSWGK